MQEKMKSKQNIYVDEQKKINSIRQKEDLTRLKKPREN